jgi:DNA-binding NarL/FixJ family response regulator
VNGWSFKIQFQGRRRTFSLAGRTRAEAAWEAQQLYTTVVSQGWDAGIDLHRSQRRADRETPAPDGAAQLLRGDLAYWEQRLIQRGYRKARLAAGAEHSVRIEHDVLELDPTVLTCLRYWLDRQPGFACPAVYRSAREALDASDHRRTALVLVNRVAPDATQQTECLRARRPGLPVFPYRLHEDSDQIFISISGVSGGYIFRRRLPTALFEPLQPAARARTLTAVEAGRHIRNYFQSFFGHPETADYPLEPVALTNREQEILNHISRGYLDMEIADLLNISIWTVHNHGKKIYEEPGVHNRTEAILKYLQR